MIKNVIFDLGGVIIDIKRDSAVEALTELGITESDKLLGEYEQKGVFLLLEEGQISDAEMYDTLLPLCTPGTTCTGIQNAFEKFLIGIPVERLRIIDRLRDAGFKTYVLSNTNPIFFDNWIAEAFRADGKSINDYFDGIVTSFQEQVCKPNPLIMKRLLQRYSLNPEETVFLDDSVVNCKMGESEGVRSITITPEGPSSLQATADTLLNTKSFQ